MRLSYFVCFLQLEDFWLSRNKSHYRRVNLIFPKKINCEYIFVGTSHPEADSNGNRKLFRGKYGCFTHHDLNNELIINQFKKRIQRLNEYLSVTNDEVVFLRTVMEEDEIDLLNKFELML